MLVILVVFVVVFVDKSSFSSVGEHVNDGGVVVVGGEEGLLCLPLSSSCIFP